MNKAKETLIRNIKEKMEFLQIEPTELAKRVGVSKQWAYNVIKEKRFPSDKLDKIAEVLNCSVADLFAETSRERMIAKIPADILQDASALSPGDFQHLRVVLAGIKASAPKR